MNNLTTRKIVFGMLMTLVLAFSVQGIADALTLEKDFAYDLQTAVDDGIFTISFTPTETGDVEKEAVKISVGSTSRAKITRIVADSNIYNFEPSTGSSTLGDAESSHVNEFTSGQPVVVTFDALSTGEVKITVSDATSSTELRKTNPDTPKAPSLVYTVYITKHPIDVNRK